MNTLRILEYPDPRLKTQAKWVENIQEPQVQSMIKDMLQTLEKTEHCGGLAATQLDIADPYRIFVYYDYENDNPAVQTACAVINPEIIHTEGEVLEDEGCMSVYPEHVHASVARPARTTLRALDQTGKMFERTRGGYLAKLFIHEVDHLNGTLYIDHLKPLKRQLLDKKILKLRKKLR